MLAGLQSGENKAQHEITVLSTSTLADKASFEARVALIKATMAELRAHTRDLELLAEEQDTCALRVHCLEASQAAFARHRMGCSNMLGCICRCFQAPHRLSCNTEPASVHHQNSQLAFHVFPPSEHTPLLFMCPHAANTVRT